MSWPDRSPDLTPNNFFLWGHFQSVIYAKKPRELPELKQIITDEILAITPDMLKYVINLTSDPLHKVITINGRQVDV
jgi:hypothetical protein